jgi:ABC-type lipopolysaccharide export system ATPase subunit
MTERKQRSTPNGKAAVAIAVHDLGKKYNAVEALKAVNLEVQQGEIFALLGPTVPARRRSFRS